MSTSERPGWAGLLADTIVGSPAAGGFLRLHVDFESLVSEAARLASTPPESPPGVPEERKAVALVARVPAIPWAGPLSGLLKCAISVRLAAELAGRRIRAVPVCIIAPGGTGAEDETALAFLDGSGNLRRLDLTASGPGTNPEIAADAAVRIPEQLGVPPGPEVPEWLAALREGLVPGIGAGRACRLFLERLFGRHGLICLDAPAAGKEALHIFPGRGDLDQELRRRAGELRARGYGRRIPGEGGLADSSRLDAWWRPGLELPVAAWVADAEDAEILAWLGPLLASAHSTAPAIWPFAGATLVDPRSAKRLKKYGLDLQDLRAGVGSALGRLGFDSAVREGGEGFRELEGQIMERSAELERLAPAVGRDRRRIADSRRRILFQVGKLRQRLEEAGAGRSRLASAHLERLRGALFPEGRPQAEVVSAPWFLNRYSDGLIPALVSALDPSCREHQVLFME